MLFEQDVVAVVSIELAQVRHSRDRVRARDAAIQGVVVVLDLLHDIVARARPITEGHRHEPLPVVVRVERVIVVGAGWCEPELGQAVAKQRRRKIPLQKKRGVREEALTSAIRRELHIVESPSTQNFAFQQSRHLQPGHLLPPFLC